ncbi:MAG: phosphate/phosphite/phosphonate ABC transporter substrate-binding protein [Bdellovibrionota bacterium]
MKNKMCLFYFTLFLFSCTTKSPLGSADNPIKFYLVPGQDAQVLETNGKLIESWLAQETGYHFEIRIPLNYISVVESFGSKRADMALINTFGAILAKEKYQATIRLRGIHFGRDFYNGQIIVRKNKIKKLEELNGKKFAFVDPASASGYLMAADLLKKKNIQPKEFIFAGAHDSAVMMVYQGKVDGAATFYSPESKGDPQDARKLVKTQLPDVFEKIAVLALTDAIPNDPVLFSKDFPDDMKGKISLALKKWIKTSEGQKTMMILYNMSDLRDSSDEEYDGIRQTLLRLGKTAAEFIK